MSQSCYYDEKDDVIITRVADYPVGPEGGILFVKDVAAVANQFPEKKILLINWETFKLTPDMSQNFSKTGKGLLQYVRAVAHYNFVDAIARVNVRVEVLKSGSQLPTNFFPTKEAALQAIHEGRLV